MGDNSISPLFTKLEKGSKIWQRNTIIPFVHRKTKTVYNFGLSEYNRDKEKKILQREGIKKCTHFIKAAN